MPATTNEYAHDVLPSDTEPHRQLAITDTGLIQASCFIHIECWFVMFHLMLRGLQDFEIADPIVGLVAVDVMDVLACSEFTPDVSFHDQSVFVDLPIAVSDDAITRGVKTMFDHALAVTLPATEPLPGIGRIFEELTAAKGASNRYLHGVCEIPYPYILRKYGIAGLIAGGGAAAAATQQQQPSQ